ncbi:MAG: hypothetical protein IT435_00435 [Phycisphaerales bacterium]|nr:hypothetical protein [Phycisphaerales bacterium]
MSTLGPNDNPPIDAADAGRENFPPRRGVSVSLRGGEAGSHAADAAEAMDPANQSLADALRITYRLVQLAMIVLGILFIISGFKTVNEGEQGIRLLFGRRGPELLQPGPNFSAPYPLGELVKVSTGALTVDLSDEFWPNLTAEEKNKPIAELNGRNSLKPESDGSVITADGGLAHTKWSVRYRRTDPGIFSESLLPEIEQELIRAAVGRGVVFAAAGTKVDDLLKQSNDDAGSLASRARDVAQRTLDNARSGITIERLSLVEKMPPLYLKDKFAAVQTAAQVAQQKQEEAGSLAQQALNKAAGGASVALVRLIDQYEIAIEKADIPAQEKLLAQIDTILEGRAEEASLQVAGEVTKLLSEATQYRSSISNQRRSDVSAFLAKQEQFASNPLVTVHREWSEALKSFLAHPTVEQMLMPPGTTTLTMVINRDPMIARDIEMKAKLAENEAAAADRARKQKEAQFNVDTGLKRTPQS